MTDPIETDAEAAQGEIEELRRQRDQARAESWRLRETIRLQTEAHAETAAELKRLRTELEQAQASREVERQMYGLEAADLGVRRAQVRALTAERDELRARDEAAQPVVRAWREFCDGERHDYGRIHAALDALAAVHLRDLARAHEEGGDDS